MKIRKRFNIHNVALVGDRGMITSARIREDLLPVALDWISALRNADICKLFKDQKDSEIDTELCVNELQRDQVAEIVSAEFPGERLLVCLNPRLRQERAQKREQLLRATETILTEIRPRRGSNSANRDRTIKRLGREALNRRKVEKHFDITVTNARRCCGREISSESTTKLARGIYVIRTARCRLMPSTPMTQWQLTKVLSTVERAFRTIKTTRLEVQPGFMSTAKRMYADMCSCACSPATWNGTCALRLKPFLFDDEQPPSRSSPVQQAKVSQAAAQKASSKKTSSGDPAHSMTTLLADLATLCLNEVPCPDFPMTSSQPPPNQPRCRVKSSPHSMSTPLQVFP